jgi:hypothetical protein
VPGISSGRIDLNHYGDTPENVKAEWAKGPVLETRQADAAEPVEGSHQ